MSPMPIVEVDFISASSAFAATKEHWGASASVPWFRVRARATFEVGARILHHSWGRGVAGRGSGAGNRAHLQCLHGRFAEEDGTGALPCRPICVAAPRMKTAHVGIVVKGEDHCAGRIVGSKVRPAQPWRLEPFRRAPLLWARDSLINAKGTSLAFGLRVTIIWPAIEILAACVAFWSRKFVVWTW